MKTAARRFQKVRRVQGRFDAEGKKFGIVVSRFNEVLTNRLLEGALDILIRHGAKEKNITVVHVPGAWELALAARRLTAQKKLDAVITLAVVIRGRTKHFDQVVEGTTDALTAFSKKSDIPLILGVIAADSIEDAEKRTGIKEMNKGREWALAAIEMADLMARLRKSKRTRS